MVAKKRTPRKALLRILAMAEEMSHCTAYGAHDEDGIYLGVSLDVEKDLEAVRRWLGVKEGE